LSTVSASAGAPLQSLHARRWGILFKKENKKIDEEEPPDSLEISLQATGRPEAPRQHDTVKHLL